MADLSALSFSGPIAILGLGVSGSAVADACVAARIPFAAWVDDEAARTEAAKKYPIADIVARMGDYAALVPSAGIKPSHPVLVAARHHKVPILSDIDLLLRANPQARVVGITGTNGKSTTTALIGHILRAAGLRAEMGGNIGVAACRLPNLGADGVYVLELSSYQLAITADPVCDVAVFLNITPDHLDWHRDFDDYLGAKKKILNPRSGRPLTAIIGIDTPDTAALTHDGKTVTVSTQKQADIMVRGTSLYEGQNVIADLSYHAFLKGRHNFENMAAAFAVCRELGLAVDVIVKHMLSFEGLPHRQKKVRTIGHVTFINDSKATNADATSRALASFDSLFWIVGGLPKSDGIDGLEGFYPKIRQAFLIGEAEDRFAKKLDGHVPATRCGTLDVALRAAYDAARDYVRVSGGHAVVLLSPACASFDQFKNFEQRGDMFARYVMELAV
jgi:UDP-N-acetylmuramoylalanine--D-glutamate ligase